MTLFILRCFMLMRMFLPKHRHIQCYTSYRDGEKKDLRNVNIAAYGATANQDLQEVRPVRNPEGEGSHVYRGVTLRSHRNCTSENVTFMAEIFKATCSL